MDTRTGEIVFLEETHHHANGQPIRAGLVPISEREARHLKGRAAKDRTAELKRMRKKAIKDAKALIGRKLNAAEVETALDACEV